MSRKMRGSALAQVDHLGIREAQPAGIVAHQQFDPARTAASARRSDCRPRPGSRGRRRTAAITRSARRWVDRRGCIRSINQSRSVLLAEDIPRLKDGLLDVEGGADGPDFRIGESFTQFAVRQVHVFVARARLGVLDAVGGRLTDWSERAMTPCLHQTTTRSIRNDSTVAASSFRRAGKLERHATQALRQVDDHLRLPAQQMAVEVASSRNGRRGSDGSGAAAGRG